MISKRVVTVGLVGLAAAAVVVVLQITVLPVQPGLGISDKRDPITVQVSGNDEYGTMSDAFYGGPDHNMYAFWDMGVREEVGSGDARWSEITLSLHAANLPDDADGHLKCPQIAVDWRLPPFENHYDMRRLVNCNDFSTVQWTFSERSTDNSTDGGPEDCVGAREVPCVSVMGRVQFAMYIPYYFGSDRAITGPIECRVFPGGVALADCTSWDPWGQLAASRTKIMYSGGGVDYAGSLNATSPDTKRKIAARTH